MKIAILGAGGRLGAALLREYRDKFDVAGLNHAQLDLSDLGAVREKLRNTSFDVLVNTAGFTKVDLCETQPDRAFLINAEAPRVVAEVCDEKNARLIHFSTDYVFDGVKREPYTEEDHPSPISAYGESKLAGEKNVLAVQNQNLVVRVSWVFGPDRPSFIDANVSGGILHFANAGKCSWQEYAQWAVDCCHDAGLPLKAKTIGAQKLQDMANWIARRPVYSVLSTAKYTKFTGISPRTWREAVSDYITRFYTKK